MRFNHLILLALVSVVGCSTAPVKDRNRAKLHMQIGTGYLSQGLYPQAMVELTKAERLDPENPIILNNLGLAYYVRERLTEAEAKFRASIKVQPDFSEAKNNLARVLIDQQRYNEALKVLKQVEGDLTYANPEKTLANLGMTYFYLGQFKRAEDALARSLQIRRESCTPSHFYGRTLLELKRGNDAAEQLDHAVEFCRTSRFEDPLFFSAMSYFSLGDREKSRARLEELLKDYPKSKYVAKAKGMLELLQQ